MAISPAVVLEIGTAKVRVLVGEAREGGNILISGQGETSSLGVRKGIIVDLEKAADCVKRAIHQAEDSGKVSIEEVNLVVSGGNIQSVVNTGSVPLFGTPQEVTPENMDEVANIARSVNLAQEREIFHTITQKYTVDQQRGIVNPERMQGGLLALDMLIVHGIRSLLSQFVQTARSVGLEVASVADSSLCAALASLTPEQKECGALVIDLGAGVTNYLLYHDSVIACIGSLAVGGDHVTNDIALAFNLSMKRAEILKKDAGAAQLNLSTPYQRFEVKAESGFAACSVAANDLYTVINARVTELFEIIRDNLALNMASRSLGAGVILTGGGAYLKGITGLAERIFGMPCSIGKPKNFSGMPNAYESAEYAAVLGMLRLAIQNNRQMAPSNLWQKFWHWIKY